ncbi:MAG: 30S ribosomal protein S14 [Bernardetiaceae bacterium]|nr:30S ribosomal protein S14 [Bernardetiaceae bacterium]
MAKKSIIAREAKREKLVAQYAEKRAALKKLAKNGDVDAQIALDKLPKNSSPVRLHNRCRLSGRPKGYMRRFGISRVAFRKLASEGKIPGVTKSSW